MCHSHRNGAIWLLSRLVLQLCTILLCMVVTKQDDIYDVVAGKAYRRAEEKNVTGINNMYSNQEGKKEIPVIQPFTGYHRLEVPQPAYGPYPRRDCRLWTDILDPRRISEVRDQIQKCSERYISCDYAEHSKYQTIDGSCNNLKNPSWGKSNNCFRRILPFDYADKISYPRESCTGGLLPNARLVSNVLHKEIQPLPIAKTTHFLGWGQMMGHDLSFNVAYREYAKDNPDGIQCCHPEPHYSDKCMSIYVPPNDPFYTKFNKTCIMATRTEPCNLCQSGARVHLNQHTSYHDLSVVYGATEEIAQKLRSGVGGRLKVQYNKHSEPMPPTSRVEGFCFSPKRGKKCYKTGDLRANQNPFLLTVQTYLFRNHNFICQELSKINPHWDDERLYQEARRINIAQAQYITFGLYLPEVLGEIMQKEDLSVLPGAQYTQYNPELDASVLDECATFAGRYGHTLIPSIFSEIDLRTGDKNELSLRDYYYSPFKFGQLDKVAKGMTIDRVMKLDVLFTDDTRDYLYRRLHLNEITGQDLAVLSIIRGRDHGIPGYTSYQAYLSNNTIYSFEDLKKTMPSQYTDIFEQLYDSVHDIDVYSAGLAEYQVEGGFVGPTFAVVLGRQYKGTKYGDRYYFEHGNQAGSFTPEQLMEIKRTTLARILCDTTRIQKIQIDPFKPPSANNSVVSCDEIRRFNFRLWKE